MQAWKRFGCVVALTLIAGSAAATNARSAVSINGLDTNPCTVASPCRSFGVALSQTNYGGEIVAVDSAGYGPFSIGQNVAVSGAPGVHAAITASTGTGIDISAGTSVYISNLTILGTGGGVNGIRNTGCQFVHVTNCYIQGFSGSGILDQGSYVLRLIVDHTTIDQCGIGIDLDGGMGAIDNSSINQSLSAGLGVYNSTSSVVATSVVTSTIFRWNTVGVDVAGSGATHVASVRVDRCSFNANGYGVQTTGTSSGSAQAVLFGNFVDSTNGSGTYTMYSYGNNAIGLSGATLSPLGLQ